MAILFAFCLWLRLTLSYQAGTDLLRGLDVPQYAFDGGSAAISCAYDLQNKDLYSLKWYHNNTEFYRFVPTERDKPINIGPTHKFFLREVSRTESRNILSLSKLTLNASGVYRCEVIAEHPSFRTESLESSMLVLKDQLYPPLILGFKTSYHPQDDIELICQPQRRTISEPKPSIKWFLNNQQAPQDKVITYAYRKTELILRLTAREVLDSGGTMTAECKLILGNHEKSVYKVLRVQTSYRSYLSNFYSKGSFLHSTVMISFLVSLASFCVL